MIESRVINYTHNFAFYTPNVCNSLLSALHGESLSLNTLGQRLRTYLTPYGAYPPAPMWSFYDYAARLWMRMTSEIQRGLSCSKLHLWLKSSRRSQSEIAEKCPISQCGRSLQRSWIGSESERKQMTSKI